MTPGAPEPVVRMRGIVKHFGGVFAVEDVDLDILPGEVLGLVGKNGAGKSTLMQILAGAIPPDAGEISIDGAPLPHPYTPRIAHQLGLAFMHQELQTIPLLSVAENVALGARWPRALGFSIGWRALRKSVETVLLRIGASIDPRAPVGSLSHANQRLVMIARALYHPTKVLVLDEPSASLSDAEIRHLHAVVRHLQAAGTAVVYVSHRLGEILQLTDRIVVMRDGRKVFDGPAGSIDEARLVDAIVGGAMAPRTAGRARRVALPAEASRVLLRVRNLAGPDSRQPISFDLFRGEVLGFGGLVGAGRTEVARMLAGVDSITHGTVEIGGKAVRARTPHQAKRAGIVLLPEDRRHQALVHEFSVRENVTLASLERYRLAGLPMPSRRKERSATRRMIERLQIKTPSSETVIETLSGGNQQKVVLARWLDLPVEVLIFDEPTAGIDVHAKAEFLALIQTLAEAGKGVIMIASEFAELVESCDRVIVLREGRQAGILEGEEITEQAIARLCYGQDGEMAA
jgi:ABC-type sugar transport system ATPase subunit